MSSIKLTADSGGGTFEVKAPASSGNTRVLTLPDTSNGTVLMTTSSDADRYKTNEVVQVVMGTFQNTYTGTTFADITSTSYVDYGPIFLNITPKFADSKLIFQTNVNARMNTDNQLTNFQLYDSTNSTALMSEGISHHYFAPTNAYPSLTLYLFGTSGGTSTRKIQVRVKVSGGTLNTDYSNQPRLMTLTEIKQ
jgi:hypothetical protein